MIINNTSPLRYPGGKTRARKRLDEIFNEYFNPGDFTTIASPFIGGGSFEFYMQGNYNYNIISNDLFTPLYNFWICVKNNREELVNKVYDYFNPSKEDFNNYKETINDGSDIERAAKYFTLNRSSFSGATLSGGYSKQAATKRFTQSSIDRLSKVDLRNMEIHNLNFEEFINILDGNEFLFLDPPYHIESNLYGKNGDLHEKFDHDKLHDVLSSKTNWMMTYNDDEYIRNLYSDYIIIETSWSYGMNKSKKSSELVILNIN